MKKSLPSNLAPNLMYIFGVSTLTEIARKQQRAETIKRMTRLFFYVKFLPIKLSKKIITQIRKSQ